MSFPFIENNLYPLSFSLFFFRNNVSGEASAGGSASSAKMNTGAARSSNPVHSRPSSAGATRSRSPANPSRGATGVTNLYTQANPGVQPQIFGLNVSGQPAQPQQPQQPQPQRPSSAGHNRPQPQQQPVPPTSSAGPQFAQPVNYMQAPAAATSSSGALPSRPKSAGAVRRTNEAMTAATAAAMGVGGAPGPSASSAPTAGLLYTTPAYPTLNGAMNGTTQMKTTAAMYDQQTQQQQQQAAYQAYTTQIPGTGAVPMSAVNTPAVRPLSANALHTHHQPQQQQMYDQWNNPAFKLQYGQNTLNAALP